MRKPPKHVNPEKRVKYENAVNPKIVIERNHGFGFSKPRLGSVSTETNFGSKMWKTRSTRKLQKCERISRIKPEKRWKTRKMRKTRTVAENAKDENNLEKREKQNLKPTKNLEL